MRVLRLRVHSRRARQRMLGVQTSRVERFVMLIRYLSDGLRRTMALMIRGLRASSHRMRPCSRDLGFQRCSLRGIATTKDPIGLIGLGKMGSAMGVNILKAGYPLVVYDVNGDAVTDLVAKGARPSPSPEHLASQVKTVLTMLPNDAALSEVAGTPGAGLLKGLKSGALHISCSTISPTLSRRLSQLHEQVGARYVGAPVFARPDGVAAKSAYFVAGGDQDGVREAEPVLLATGSRVFNYGPDAGAGNVVKLCGNFLIAASIEALAEALALAESQGLDRKQVELMLTGTIFDCLIYKGYGDRVARRDHRPGGFSLELGLKDVALVRACAGESGVPLPLASMLHDRFLAAHRRGRGGLDWSALALTASEESGVDVTSALLLHGTSSGGSSSSQADKKKEKKET